MKTKTKIGIAALLSLAFLLGSAVTQLVIGLYPANVTTVWVNNPPLHEADYIIGVYNSTHYYAKNGTTGEIEFCGTNASQVTNNAISAIESKGGIIFIKAGTYELSNSIIGKSNIEIIGEGGTILSVSTHITPIKFGDGTNLVQNFTIKHLTINLGNQVPVDDWYGIWLNYVDNFRIENVEIYGQQPATGIRTAAIAMDKATNGVVSKCHIHNTVNGIVPRWSGTKKIIITDNIVHDINIHDGIVPYQTDGDISIVGNIVYGCNRSGILIDGGVGSTRNNNTVVIGNVVFDCHWGIQSYGSKMVTITGNTVRNNTECGIYINAQSDFGFVISSNLVEGNGDGIRIRESRYGTITGNTVRENDGSGISLYSNSHYNTVTSNNVYLNDQHGICLNGSSYCSVTGNTIKDNSQEQNAGFSELLLTNSSASTHSTHDTITGNIIRCTQSNKAEYGIRENTDGEDYNLIVGNIVQGAVTANISIQGTHTVKEHNIE